MNRKSNIPHIHKVGKNEYMVTIFRFGTPQVLAIGVNYQDALTIKQEHMNKKRSISPSTD